MAQKIIKGNETLAKQIKSRRNELGLTIEEAAFRAGVGTKTWYRYEAGESIRKDKCKGICKALKWHSLPDQDGENTENISVQEFKNHEAWSTFLENSFGLKQLYPLLLAVISCMTTSKRIWTNFLLCPQELILDS